MKRRYLFFLVIAAVCMPVGSFSSTDYEKARVCYYEEAKKGGGRDVWDRCAKLFEAAAVEQDEEKALFSAARVRKESYLKFGNQADLNEAVRLFNSVAKKFPKGALTPDAIYNVGVLREESFKDLARARRAYMYVIENYPDSKVASLSKARLAALGDKGSTAPAGASMQSSSVLPRAETIAPVPVTPVAKAPSTQAMRKTLVVGEEASARKPAVLSWSKKQEADVLLFLFHLDRFTRYSYYVEPYGPRTNTPTKLVIVFPYTKVAGGVQVSSQVGSRWVSSLRLKKSFVRDRIKAVFEISQDALFNVRQEGSDIVVTFGRRGDVSDREKARIDKGDVVKAPRPLRVVIDPGHGGRDPGAIGTSGTKEKDIVLAVAKELRDYLKKTISADVKLTRWNDRFLTLDERNVIAEKWDADVFISLHVNASENKDLKGIEIYYLNNTTDRASIKLARQENRHSGRSLEDTEKIILTMLQNYNAEEARDLAGHIQKEVIKNVSQGYPDVIDLGVKGALFYVLVGAKCPGVLVEMSFISNPVEEKRLRSKTYQAKLAKGIGDGVIKYAKQLGGNRLQ